MSDDIDYGSRDISTCVTLERMVDNHGLKYVLERLADVCHEKSDYIAATWDDISLSKDWSILGACIDKIAHKVNV